MSGAIRRRDLQKSTPISVIGVYLGCFYAQKQPKYGYSGYIGGLSFFKIAKKSKFQLTFEYNGVIMTL